MSIHYFAYGSNMSLAQMRSRCPGSEKIGIGVLPDHRVVFPRHSPVRNCGVAGLAPTVGEDVWGVVYRLQGTDLASLDTREGYDSALPDDANRYVRREMGIHLNHDPKAILPCWTYLAVPQPGVHRPSANYAATILGGAEENGLPKAYLEKLREIIHLTH